MSSMIQSTTPRVPTTNTRRMLQWVVLGCTAVLLGAGGWLAANLISTSSHAGAAAVGEAVSIGNGTLRVDAVTPEHMAPMGANQFAAAGMSMNNMGMDMAPEGFRRFTVAVTLAAEPRHDLRYGVEQFRLSGEGMDPTSAIRYELGDGVVAGGMAITGNMVFQVPEAVHHLQLQMGDAQPVAFALATADGHTHGSSEDNNHADTGTSDDDHTDHQH